MTTENAGFACHSNVVDSPDKYAPDTRRKTRCDSVLRKPCIAKHKDLPFRYRHSLLLSTAIAALMCATDGMQPANAQAISYTGDLNYTPPGGAQTWSVGDDLVVGDTVPGSSTLLIDAGAKVDNNWGYVGNHNGVTGTVTVQGSDGSGNVSTWTNNGQLAIGVEAGSNGTLNILNGGVVTNTMTAIIGRDDTSTGAVTVSGSGSIWNSSSDFAINVGYGGSGTLEINNGGVVQSGWGNIGSQSTGNGHVTVSGSGSMWTTSSTNGFVVGDQGSGTLEINSGGVVQSGQGAIGYGSGNGHVTVSDSGSAWNTVDNIYVGLGGTGELEVLNGATVSTVSSSGGSVTIYIGHDTSSQGTVTVSSTTGDTSTLSSATDIAVGESGTGTLNIAKGGLVTASNNVYIANANTSSGTLHLNGDNTGRGILETGSVVAGAGTVDLDINGGILRANRNEADFLNGFTALTVGTEGAWFDTNNNDIGISTAFTGTSTFNKLGAGTLTLTGDSSTFTGNTQVQSGTLQVDGTLGGPTEVLAGARLTGIGQVGITTNRGVIAPGHAGTPGTLGTLTIAGNYTAAGGSIEIRTQLGDDSSPTDRLVITGSTSGTTPVTVTNFGGAGAQTTEGIKIIDVAGASTGTFTLLGNTTYQGDQAVVAGAYAYRLYQGGASTPTDGDWYLRSVLQQNASGPQHSPLYQPGVPTYEAYPQILLGLNGVPTLQQRVGNRFWSDGSAPSSADNGSGGNGAFTEANGMWVRVEGGHNRIDPKSSTSGSDYEYDTTKTQVGLDTMLSQSDSGKLVGGLSVHYVHGSADTNWRASADNYGSGNISTDGYGLGGTLTWYGNNGFYVDGTAQMTWYSSDLSAQPIHGLANSNDAFGYALSVESGKRIAMNQGWFFTPQAQLTYSKARFDDFSDVFGASVRPGRDDSLQARLGVSLERQVNRTHLYGIANVYNEFLDGTSVDVDNQTFRSRNDRLWAGIGFGASHNWNNDKYSIYGEGTFNTSLADSDSHGYGITVGFRARW